MNLSDFLAQVGFFTPKVFRSLGSCATRPSGLRPGRAQTYSLSECFRVRIPSFTQAALAKTSIRSKTRQIHFKSVLYCPLDSKNLTKLRINRSLAAIGKKEYIEIQNKIHNKMHSQGLHRVDFDRPWDIGYLERRGIL
jgi:hypothetical protein